MEVNYLAILACGIVSMILGTIWYGFLFRDKWMEIICAGDKDKLKKMGSMSKAEMQKMQQESMPLYGISFVLSLFQAWVLSLYIAGWQEAHGVVNALWIWAAFVVPTVAGGSMWNNDPKNITIQRFSVQAGYYFVQFLLFGLILYYWR